MTQESKYSRRSDARPCKRICLWNVGQSVSIAPTEKPCPSLPERNTEDTRPGASAYSRFHTDLVSVTLPSVTVDLSAASVTI